MPGRASVVERLARLAPDQRAAATAPAGPILCIAPAGSGKTTTLIARIAWLIDSGADPATIAAITFNKRAADELSERLGSALGPLGLSPGAVRVRTFHALGREILADAGVHVDRLVDRTAVLRVVDPATGPAGWRRLDDAFSRLKLDLGVTAEQVAADPSPGRIGRAFIAYEAHLAGQAGLDFDDLVGRTLRLLSSDPPVLDRWRARCAHLLVDEVQDVDRSQLRLALLLAAPANQVFLVGDDDQSIYGWRLADVRRVLALAEEPPGLRRIDLTVNYRCPSPVVTRAVRLVAHNQERFRKEIRARNGAAGRLILGPDGADDAVRVGRVFGSWPMDGGDARFAILARTNRELLPAVAVALQRGLAFRAARVETPLESPFLDELLEAAAATNETWPLLVRLGAVARRLAAGGVLPMTTDATGDEAQPGAARPARASPTDAGETVDDEPVAFDRVDVSRALLGWAPRFVDLEVFAAFVRDERNRLAGLRRDDAALTLATAHATKGLEFDYVAVIGLDEGRFPSARSLADAADPVRAMEEERRLAYVAWTRARRSLTLVYDPATPSRFLLEAFDPNELGLPASGAG